jgi:hypothetical protein
VPAVLETLRTALDPFAVAAAARAARGAAAPNPDLSTALVTALVGMRGRDDSVSFAGLRQRWPDPAATTALTEVLRTLRALGSAAHCVHTDLLEARRLHAPTWSPGVRAELDAAIEATGRAPMSLTELAPSPGPGTSGASGSRTKPVRPRRSLSSSAAGGTSSPSSTPGVAIRRSARRP